MSRQEDAVPSQPTMPQGAVRTATAHDGSTSVPPNGVRPGLSRSTVHMPAAEVARAEEATTVTGRTVAALPSATSTWEDLVVLDETVRQRDYLPPQTAAALTAMTVTTRQGKDAVTVSATARGDALFDTADPWRHMTWRTGQRNRPGLEYLVSTGRHHAYESQQERRLLQALDWDGRVVDALSQPLRLTFSDGLRQCEHTPDLLARLSDGQTLLLNVKPEVRIDDRHRTAFAASDRLAAARGWRHEVVTGWREPARSTVDALSARRRPQADTFGLVPEIEAALVDGPLPFGALVERTRVPAIARAVAIGMLWRRRLTVDLAVPLEDTSLVALARQEAA
jgi:hypothetical protein